MTRPLTHTVNVQTGEEIVREMTDAEYAEWQNNIVDSPPAPTKEQLLAQLQALQAQIQALE